MGNRANTVLWTKDSNGIIETSPAIYTHWSEDLPKGFEKLKETDLGKFLSSFKFPQVGSESCPQPHHPLLESLGIDAKPEIPCWIWSYIRTLILILACLAAYRIVFDD